MCVLGTAPIFAAPGSANRSSVSRSRVQVVPRVSKAIHHPLSTIHCGLQRGMLFALPQSPFHLLKASLGRASEMATNAPVATLVACPCPARMYHMPRTTLTWAVGGTVDLGVGPASSMLVRTRQPDKPCCP
jgi:hypothetical protein